MAAIFTTLFWCALQVSLFLLLAAPIYLLVRRRNPSAGTAVAASALGAVVVLSALAISPWPRWSMEWSTPTSAAVEHSAAEQGGVEVEGSAAPISAESPTPAALGDDSLLAAFWRAAQYNGESAAPSAGSAAPAARRVAWPSWIVWAIAVGVVLGAAHLLMSLAAVRRLIGRSTPLDDLATQQELDDLRRQLKVTRPISLHVSAEISTPATVGMLQPAIILPTSWTTWTAVERRAVLAHELAHIAGRDFAAWLVARGAVVLHFYHPLVRWFVGRLQLDQELAADDTAARLLGDRKAYLQALASLALATPHERLSGTLRTFIPTRSLLVRRVEMLRTNVASNSASRRLRRALRGTALLTIIALTVTIAGIRPESQAGEERVAAKSPEATEPTSTVKLSGVVVDSQGSPVSNAIVAARRDRRQRENSVTHTLSDGTFTLEVVPSTSRPTLSWAWAYAEGHGVRTVNLHRFSGATSPVIADLVLKLPPTERSEFVVLDPLGKPVAGAIVSPWYIDWPNGVYSADEPTGLTGPIPEEIARMLQRTTDEAGRVSFDAVPKAVLESVRVQTPEFGVQDFRRPKKELQLKPVGKVEGRIVSQHLEELKDLKIYLAADDGMGKEGEAIVVVDEAGRFVVPAMASGKLRMGMAWPEDLPTRPELKEGRPTLEAGKTLQLEVVERPIVAVRGRIVAGKDRTPVPGAQVSLRNGRSPEMPQHVETNEEGWFEAKTIAGNQYMQVVSLGDDKLIATTYDYPRNLPNVSISEGVEEFQLDEIVLNPKEVLSGKLVGRDGSPGAKATVGLRRGNSFRHLAGFATTDAQGEFHMPVSDWKSMQQIYRDVSNEWLLISQPESSQETPTRTPLKVVSEEPLVLQEP